MAVVEDGCVEVSSAPSPSSVPEIVRNYNNKLSAVVFDFDGTLANSFDLFMGIFEAEVNKRITSQVGHDELADIVQGILMSEVEQGMKSPKKLLMQIFYRTCRELGLSRVSSGYVTCNAALRIQRRYNEIELFPKAEDLLSTLHEEGIPTVLVTLSSKKHVLEILRKNDLENYFHIVLDKKDLGDLEKTHGIRQALQALGVDSSELERVLAIGDLPSDISDGKQVGVKTAAVLTGPMVAEKLIDSEPDYVFSDLADFLTIFKRSI